MHFIAYLEVKCLKNPRNGLVELKMGIDQYSEVSLSGNRKNVQKPEIWWQGLF